MLKVREILRLTYENQMGVREVAISCSISPTNVSNYLKRFQATGLRYEAIQQLDDRRLATLLLDSSKEFPSGMRQIPDFKAIHSELKKKGVTLKLLWQEYQEAYPEVYQYSQFCELYRRWKQKLRVTLRQTHLAGDKLFVDYAGQTVEIKNPKTGKARSCQIFVAVLGASNFTYCEATWSQGLSDWISSHCRAFEFFGGVTKAVVPDNLKSGVSKACYYEPEINRTYLDLAIHYKTCILPARVRKPRDKAKAEAGVLLVERWILAVLRKRTFFSLEEVNQAIGLLLDKLNRKSFQKLEGSRLSCFETLEKKALLALPAQRFSYAQWKKAKVNVDYHVELFSRYYSVPFKYSQEEVQIRFNENTVEIFHHSLRIAVHRRINEKGRHSTEHAHMPEQHEKYLKWPPSRIMNWASQVGVSTRKVVETILLNRQYPQQGYRSCFGILRLAMRYNDQRLEAACTRAIVFGEFSYSMINSILEKGLDRLQISPNTEQNPPIAHQNVRGKEYFQFQEIFNEKEANVEHTDSREAEANETSRHG